MSSDSVAPGARPLAEAVLSAPANARGELKYATRFPAFSEDHDPTAINRNSATLFDMRTTAELAVVRVLVSASAPLSHQSAIAQTGRSDCVVTV